MITWGRLVDKGTGGLWLVSHEGDKWPAGPGTKTRLAGRRNRAEGRQRVPRPWTYDPQGKPIVRGDYVLVAFLDDDPASPVILDTVGDIEPDEPDFFPANPLGSDPNPLRERYAVVNAAGVVTGTLQVRALDGGNGWELVVGGGQFGVGTRLEIDHDAGTIKLGQGAETHPVPLGDNLLDRLKTIVEQVMAVDASQAAKLPTSAPLTTATLTPVLADIAQSLATGAPLLSAIVKVE